uniref:Cytochrome P450 CYP405A19 n=1 Tax=Calycopis cecrops TaxID=691633 RepID=A0A2Z6JST0_9NEOP|nr:TPA_inf: cytochrome P450 CYP405A19 [Calycopis cecrops]
MLPISVLLLVIIFLIVLQNYVRKHSYYWKKLSEFPGDPPLPLIGNMLQLGFDSDEMHLALMSMWKRHGKQNFRLNIGSKNWIMLTNEEDVKTLLNHTKELSKPSPRNKSMMYFFGMSVSSSEGERWRLTRKLMSASLSNSTLASQVHFINDYSKQLFNHLDNFVDKNEVDFYKYLMPYTLDIIIETLMGVDSSFLNDLDNIYLKESGKAIRILTENMFSYWRGNTPLFEITPMYREMINCASELRSYSMKVINKRKEILRENGNLIREDNLEDLFIKNGDIHESEFAEIRRDEYVGFLDNLLLCQDYKGGSFSDEMICDELTLITFAGHYTISVTISHALFCMAKYPEVQKKVHEEQKYILKNNISSEIDIQDLHEMKFLEAVMKEAIRFFPTISSIGRELQNDLRFQDGRVAPAGTILAVFYEALYHNEEAYPEPENFNPERFLDPINKFSFVPFSAGPRGCIGYRFAWMTMKATLSHLLRRYEFFPGDSEPQFVARVVTESKNGVKLKLRRRIC